MAEADEERWEVDEENLIINSVQLMQNIGDRDDQSSSATSYSASVTNSPQADPNPGSISDDAQL